MEKLTHICCFEEYQLEIFTYIVVYNSAIVSSHISISMEFALKITHVYMYVASSREAQSLLIISLLDFGRLFTEYQE